ncbi:MAG: DNA mismatch repair endonuclease MutL [Planctomycetes bacterium]|nr:DNA mismatch repair endonuclease MutL [Planctomycetota bacterium]
MIKKLPTAVINQIAAGEVVERPYSVVKELVENSLDAGARRIRIEVRNGGADAIRILDDGDGFLPEDLPLAFASHATSKLSSVADLDHIGSLGFRGEALASIGAVSRARIRSRRHGAMEGWEVTCDGGVEVPPMPCGCPEGTQIDIRDLFYNVPARRRFLKSAGAERARIQELIAELSLARLDVDFTLVADDRELLRLPAGDTLTARFCRCFGEELGRGLLPVQRAFSGLQVEGLVAEPDLARRDSKLELCYVNGRLARETSAVHAVRQAYREYLMGGRFPVYMLHVVLPPDQVDVNIHPRKAEVRFVESRKVAGCMHETVRAALQGRGFATSGGGVIVGADLPRAKSGFPDLPPSLFGDPRLPEPYARTTEPVPVHVREIAASSRSAPLAAAGAAESEVVPEPVSAPISAGAPAGSEPAARENPFQRVSGRYLQVMDLYLLLEGPDGLLVVDQHALHERVVYERLRNQHDARAVQIQRLLVPTVVEVTPSEQAWVVNVRDELAAEGLLVDAFGPSSIAVHGVPAVLSRLDPKKLVRLLLGSDQEDGRRLVRDQIAEKFHSMACRSAVMSGDKLTDAEIQALLEAAAKLEHPHNCPHGRPTVLTFGAFELERYFRRRC